MPCGQTIRSRGFFVATNMLELKKGRVVRIPEII